MEAPICGSTDPFRTRSQPSHNEASGDHQRLICDFLQKHPELVDSDNELHAFFAPDVPVYTTLNLQRKLGLSKHTQGYLHSIIFDDKENITAMSDLEPGNVHTLQYAPLAVSVPNHPSSGQS
jgi:hypothetical protein